MAAYNIEMCDGVKRSGNMAWRKYRKQRWRKKRRSDAVCMARAEKNMAKKRSNGISEMANNQQTAKAKA